MGLGDGEVGLALALDGTGGEAAEGVVSPVQAPASTAAAANATPVRTRRGGRFWLVNSDMAPQSLLFHTSETSRPVGELAYEQ